jgi:hypothetical protein
VLLEQLQIVLPVLGVNVLRGRTADASAQAAVQDSPVFVLKNAKYGVDARAQQIGDEFTMRKGSRVVGKWTGTGKAESTQRAYALYRARHERLIADGSILVQGDVGVLTRDVPFTSPSTAAAVASPRVRPRFSLLCYFHCELKIAME